IDSSWGLGCGLGDFGLLGCLGQMTFGSLQSTPLTCPKAIAVIDATTNNDRRKALRLSLGRIDMLSAPGNMWFIISTSFHRHPTVFRVVLATLYPYCSLHT